MVTALLKYLNLFQLLSYGHYVDMAIMLEYFHLWNVKYGKLQFSDNQCSKISPIILLFAFSIASYFSKKLLAKLAAQSYFAVTLCVTITSVSFNMLYYYIIF